ncbi:MAG: hypothetical protein ACI9QL_004053 [Candidatus Omnitrophota bacterium]|jgi:hypothetical protein
MFLFPHWCFCIKSGKLRPYITHMGSPPPIRTTMKKTHFAPLVCLLTLLLTGSSYAQDIPPEQLKFFEERIRPVLSENCYTCHSKDAKRLKGGLYLDTLEGMRRGGDTGPAIVPGKAGESLLLSAISHADPKLKMPKKRLPKSVIEDFRTWVDMGAPDPRKAAPALVVKDAVDYEAGRAFWAFIPPRQVDAKPKDAKWPRTEIDRYVRVAQEANGIKPVGDASRRTLIRRLTFDLIGLPPTPGETRAFIEDTRPDADARLVDRLLASPQFGERWGRHWMDVARYAESTGMERNYSFSSAWRYRDYIIDAFNHDKPFDQFIREQIAGDLLPATNADQEKEMLIATGFLAIGPKSLNERDKKIFKMDMVDEQIDVTSRAFLGLTVSCARCHDHKFDPISTRDYYSIAGFFTSTATHYGTGGGQGNRQPSKLMPIGEEGDQTTQDLHTAHDAKLEKVQQEFARLQKKIKTVKKPPEMVKQDWVLEQKGRQKELGSLKKQIDSLKKQKQQLPSLPMAMGVQDGRPEDTPILVRGDVAKRGPIAQRGFLQVIARNQRPEIPKDQSGRVQLAEWISARENPLTARVTVNRVWHHLFGQGIVPTVDNFGETGERPSNLPLLDHLALSLMEHDWSIKHLIKTVVLSRTYQLSSESNEMNYQADPENRTHWQMSHRRLDAEALRDAILHVSGQLTLTPPVGSIAAKNGVEVSNDPKFAAIINRVDFTQRSVYLPIIRNLLPEMFNTFDFAEPSIIVGRRNVTTVPTQALFMLNSEFMLTYSSALAQRVMQEAGDDPAARIERAYALALNREPVSAEREEMQTFVGALSELPESDAWAAAVQSLMASAEFRYIE